MISKISTYFTQKLISHGAIKIDEFDLYVYGLFILITHILFCALTLFLGLIFNVLLESIIFYFSFSLIRKYAGGYHAATETRCEIMSTLSILACIAVIRLSKFYDLQNVLFVLSAMSALCIAILCPLDTPEKPLSDNEFRHFRKISWLILSVISLVAIISYFINLKWLQIFFFPCCLSLVLESVLLVAGKLKKLTVEKFKAL